MNPALIGAGWITPLGRNIDAVWSKIGAQEKPSRHSLDHPSARQDLPVYRIAAEDIRDTAGLPRLRRSSAISHYAVAAAFDAVERAGLTEDQLSRTALVFAASDGGVIYTRRFYADIVDRGEGSGSPLLFPETVYNAPSSHIAARLRLKGEALTIVGDASTGIAALQTASELLALGEADTVIVAASQELDWITSEAYARWGLINDSDAIFAEGAAALVLARDGGDCRIRQIHSGASYTTEKQAAALFREMAQALAEPSPDILVPSSAGSRRLDKIEDAILSQTFPGKPVLKAKTFLGEALTCSTLHQIILAWQALKTGAHSSALVTALGFNGQLAGLVLTCPARRG